MRSSVLLTALAGLMMAVPAHAQDWTVDAGESEDGSTDEPGGEDADAEPDEAGETDDDEAASDAEVEAAFEDDEIELQPEELAELEEDDWDVSAFGSAREVKRVAGSAHRIDQEQLERFEDDNIHNTLRRVPGVYVRGEDGYGLRPNIGLRGADSDRSAKITLMEDGVLFGPAPYSAPAAYYFPLSTRMTAIEVFKGPSALRHGPHTIGGAINMVTRPIPWGHAFGADLALGTEAYGKGHVHYGYGTDHWGVLVEGVRLRSDGFKQLDNNVAGRDTGFDKLETMIKARVNTDPSGDVYNEGQIKLGYAREESNETYLGLTDDDFGANHLRRYAASERDHMSWDRFQVELSHALGVGDWLRMRTTAYRHDFQRSWFRFDGFRGGNPTAYDTVTDPTRNQSTRVGINVLRGQEDSTTDLIVVDNDRTFVAQGIQTSASIKLPDLWRFEQKLKTGARFHYDSIDRLHTDHFFAMRNGRLQPVFDGPGVQSTEVSTDNDARSYAVSGYLVDEIAIWRFLLSPGVRVEYVTSDFESPTPVGPRRVETSQGAFLPGVGLLFQATDNISLLAGVHQGFSPVPPGQDPDQEPETATNYEFGSRFDSAIVGGEVIGFVSDYENFTNICGASSGCDSEEAGVQFGLGSALLWGVEVSGNAEIPTPVDLSIPLTMAYTFTKGTFDGSYFDPVVDQVVQGGDIISVPNHQAAVTAGIASKRWGSLVLGGTYVDSIRQTPGIGDPGPSDETDPYVIFDAAGTLQVTEVLAVYAKAENILDNQYIISRRPFGARPGRPRFFYAGVKVALD